MKRGFVLCNYEKSVGLCEGKKYNSDESDINKIAVKYFNTFKFCILQHIQVNIKPLELLCVCF